jgi:sugar lactone lactonase YvrE
MKKPKILKAIVTLASLAAAMLPIRTIANPGDLYVSDNTSIRKYAPDGTGTIFASGLSRPRGVAFDNFGNLFVSTLDTAPGDNQGRILKFASDGTFTVFVNLHSPNEGITFHRLTGNLFDANNPTGTGTFNTSTIQKITPSGNARTLTTLSDPSDFSHLLFDVAFDSDHTLFAADQFASAIYMVTPSGKVAPFATVNNVDGLAFDSAGNLYASDELDGMIIKIAPDGTESTFVSGLAEGPRGLAFDAQGNLFVAGHASNTGTVVYKITPDGTVSIFATGLAGPEFLAFEPTVHP